MVALQIPAHYGYTMLSATALPFITNLFLGGPVMAARKKFDVQYPNLYATPGHHKHADEFNRVQRGHQNLFESLPHVISMILVGGLKYPLFCAACGVLYSLGSYLFLVGYSDTKLDVKMARYKKGGGLKWIGILGAFGACCVASYSFI